MLLLTPSRKKTKKSKRERVPPLSLGGFETYLRNRGFQIDPPLQDPQDADLTASKPLPDGSRLHLRVKEGTNWLNVEEHRDSSDPSRSPIGHVINDVFLNEPETTKYRILKRKFIKKTRRTRA